MARKCSSLSFRGRAPIRSNGYTGGCEDSFATVLVPGRTGPLVLAGYGEEAHI